MTRSPLGPGARRSAPPDSWHGPCGPPSGSSRRAPWRRRPQPRARPRPGTTLQTRCVVGVERGSPRVIHRLVSEHRLAARHETIDTGTQRSAEGSGIDVVDARQRGPTTQEERSVQGPAGAADRAHQGHADLLEQRVSRLERPFVQRSRRRLSSRDPCCCRGRRRRWLRRARSAPRVLVHDRRRTPGPRNSCRQRTIAMLTRPTADRAC